jgi:thioredoxin-like negative regulator of GroEL
VRAELAAVLLQSRKYDEAAREYRVLLARDPGNFEYRLGLARALAWGDRPRDAERELLLLRARRPNAVEVDSLLRSVRVARDPSSLEARGWLSERPDYAPYRLALARALTREREHSYAIAQYDTLIASSPTALLYAERARARSSAGDRAGADSDLTASFERGPTVSAYLTAGELYGERGDYAAARAMYSAARARQTRGDEATVDAALAQLARDERPVIAFVPDVAADDGWRLGGESSTDNLGVRYLTSSVERTKTLGDGTTVSLEGEQEYIGERSAARSIDLAGYGGTVAVAKGVSRGEFLVRGRVRGGALYHPDAGMIPRGSIAGAAWYGPWELGVQGWSGPAYPSLLTTTSLVSVEEDESPLTEESASVSLGGPLGVADAAVTMLRSRLSDGNRRSSVQAYLRYPLSPRLALVYAGSGVAFAERSARYWDPLSYAAHGAGVEVATRRSRGFSLVWRVIPTIAWSRESPVVPVFDFAGEPAGFERGEPVSRESFQLTAGGEATWRTAGWEAAAAATYGSGRAGDYRRLELTLGLRILE